MRPTWPLVGRDGELEQVAAAMDARMAGVLLVGPAGVGKTRLATEALALAGPRGWTTAVVRANRSAATIPFGAFAPLLPAAPAPGAEGQADALRSAAKAVATGAGHGTLALLVDDVQELDEASSALLHVLAADPSVFLVVTVRGGDGVAKVPEAVIVLWKDELLSRIDVPSLSLAAVERIMSEALEGPVDGGTVHAIWSTSGGNALFVRELVMGALDAGALQEANGLWRLRGNLSPSTRLGEVVGLRLGGLGDDERRALEVVSVGEPVGLIDLEQLVSSGTVDNLDRRGLLDISTEGARQQVRMGHPLHGEVVRAGLTAVRRRETSRALAEVVEARGAQRREDTLRVALWRLEGGGADRPQVLIAGAHQARFAFDVALTERLARAALALGAGCDAACLLGEALDMLGRHGDAEQVLSEAETLAVTDHDRTVAALARSANLFRGLGRAGDAEAVIAAAQGLVSDEALRDELRAQLAIHLLFEGRIPESLALTDPLLARPEDRAFVHAALPGAVARAVGGRTSEAIEIADRAFEARVELGDQVQMPGPGIYVVARALALVEAGRLAEAEEYARLGYAGAAERRLSDGQAWFSVILGNICLHQGRVVTASRWYREAAIIYGDYNHAGARWGYGGLAHALALAGDLDGADTAIADLDAEPATPLRLMDPEIDRGRACVLVQRGEHTLARGVLRNAAVDAGTSGRFALESAVLYDLARLGDPGSVVARLRELSATVDGIFHQARLAHVEAMVGGDAAQLDAAAVSFEAVGAMLLAAEAAAAASRAYSRDGLARRATETRQRAVRCSDACEGAQTLRFAGELGAVSLTRREREVAELGARGLSSREIAEKLFVSTRTVENHLQRAYEKLGVSGRAGLARVLGSSGIGAGDDGADEADEADGAGGSA